MLTDFYNLLTIRTYKNGMLRILTLFIIIVLFFLAHKHLVEPQYERNVEGFTQGSPYILKTDDDIYDDFYVAVYDLLYRSEERGSKELRYIIDATHPSVNRSNILDLGCGTGYLVNMLSEDGFVTHGIDKSDAMIDYCNEKYDNKLSVINGNALDPIQFEPNSFSHVICTNFTVYEFSNIKRVVMNVNKWLKPNGYFIVHLVDPLKFDTTIPASKPSIKMNPQEHSDVRITKSHINFDGFSYASKYVCENSILDDSQDYTHVVHVNEVFEDFENKQKRENEHKMIIPNLEDMESLVQRCGFHMHSKASHNKIYGGDNFQHIYVFEKIH